MEFISYMNFNQKRSQQPRCKQRGIKLATLQSSGVCDPCGIRQMSASQPLGSLLAGIKSLNDLKHKNKSPFFTNTTERNGCEVFRLSQVNGGNFL